MPKNDAKTLTLHVPPRTRLVYYAPPPERHHLLFDCCVFSSIGGCLKPGPQPSLYFAMGRVSSPKAAPTARMKTNRACPPSPEMFRACASRRVGRQTAMDGGRGGGGRRRCQKKIDLTRIVQKAIELTPPREKAKTKPAEHRSRCSE